MLDIGDILKPAPNGAHPLADNDQPDADRIVAIITQQQEGINMLTDLLIKMKADIETMKVEISRLKARTDVPQRSSILRV